MKHHHHGPTGRHPHRDHRGHGRQRARRGAVGNAIIALLDEQPRYGYEIITALEEKSGGRWKPSAGSIYPALRRLEHRGFIASSESDDGKRRFELTEAGHARLTDHRAASDGEPWDQQSLGNHGELRRAMSELVGPAKQIGRFGSAEQNETAVHIIKDATAKLYRLLADGPTEAPQQDAPQQHNET